MLMKLAGLSLVKDMEIERGNWLGATKYRSMPRTQHGASRDGRGLGVKRSGKTRAIARDQIYRSCLVVPRQGSY